MQQEHRAAMAQARWIALSLYLSALVLLPFVSFWITPPEAGPAEALRVLPASLGIVALAEYGLSLLLETWLISGRLRPKTNQSPAFAAAVASAAIGSSIAVYGFVLALLGAPGWSPLFYLLSFVHGLHLGLRWPRLERAAEGWDRPGT